MKESGRLGISLPEIALILIIISSVAGGMRYLMPAQKTTHDSFIMNEKLDKIENAIYSFYLQKGYLPCPASKTTADGAATFGTSTDCSASAVSGVTDITPGTVTTTIRHGVVPVRTINLPDSYMFDPWGNRIEYSILKKAAIDSSTFSSLSTSITEDIFLVKDSSNNLINNTFTTSNKVFVTHLLYSHGKNRIGGTNSSGNTLSCASGTADYENCNDDNIFKLLPHNYTDGSSYYDDYLRWYTNKKVVYCSGATTNCYIPPAGFTPNSIYGLVTWIDASDTAGFIWYNSTSRLWWLTEKSPKGYWYDGDWSVEQSMPLYEATGFNNRPTLNLSGTAGIFFCPDQTGPTLTENKNITMFYVGSHTATSGKYSWIVSTPSATVTLNLNHNGNSNWYTHSANTGTLSSSYTGNIYASVVFNIHAPSPQAKLYVNGNLVETASAYSGFKYNTFMKKIGIGRDVSCQQTGTCSITDQFDGKVSEFLIYDRALTDSERKYIESYLKTKWGL